MTEAEKQAFVFRSNFNRRNLSPSQKTEAQKQMKATAKLLREEDAKQWTQKRVAEVLGVDQKTVSRWLDSGTNRHSPNTSKPKPDSRVKIPPERKPEIAERIAAGENREQVASAATDTGPHSPPSS